MVKTCKGQGPVSVGVILSFTREQLMYDIANCSYVESHVAAEDTEHSRHMMADVCEEGNADRVTRILDLAVATCRELLYPYTKMTVVGGTLNNDLQETQEYKIELTLPETVSQTSVQLLEHLVHEYLVCRGVAEWMSITAPKRADTWYGKAAEAESEIRSALATRMNRQRIKCHWL